MASELKLCPFCGKPPKIRRNRNDGLYIFCSFDGCDIQPAIEAFGPEKDEEIVDSWNQRVPDAGLVDALKPFAFFAKQWKANPILNHPDALYSIHNGEQGAQFRLSDCIAARAALRAVGVSHE